MEDTSERRWSKYHEMVEWCYRRSWKSCCEPIKVWCRGFTDRIVQGLHSTWHHSGCKNESYQAHHGSHKQCLQMALDQEEWSVGQGWEDTSQGVINAGWVTWQREYGVERPEILDYLRKHHWWCVPLHLEMYLWIMVLFSKQVNMIMWTSNLDCGLCTFS